MCGIFGYVGPRTDAPKIVFEGLKRLEYRGYDSWGIAVKSDKSQVTSDKLVIEKHIGKIGDSKIDSSLITYHSSLALGHTRWATHGGVTVANAHPHLDCTGQIAVVHNGIVENFQELKKELKAKGHKFASETDTEVIAHSIEEEVKIKKEQESQRVRESEYVKNAVRRAFLKLSGLNAVVVMIDGQLIAAKTGSPLVLGFGRPACRQAGGEFFVSSDAAALLPHTHDVYFLEDGQIAQVTKKTIEVFTLSGNKVPIKIQRLNWKTSEVDLGKYKYFIEKEIYEQPEIISKIALNSIETQAFARLVNRAFGTFFVACGSASYAALCGTYLL
ncbi:MAG: Glucosamine/fructose-6-phosphate aminotransferase, isomerizing [Candidatus Curtissbacteria bacterium GW2011_GWC2_41_21]|nr:MAG: Glucosamine/fructose-6-phosphate aminotransferase, isomerizing [Candidatus Curtissbacteria bacterium GW2011_GWC2_41_21]